MYRCSKCGHKSRTFAAMAKHARKHGFKRKKAKSREVPFGAMPTDGPSPWGVPVGKPSDTRWGISFCPNCGYRLTKEL